MMVIQLIDIGHGGKVAARDLRWITAVGLMFALIANICAGSKYCDTIILLVPDIHDTGNPSMKLGCDG